MADTTDIQATGFCNELLRPAADKLTGLIPYAENLLSVYKAKNLGPLFGHPTDLLTNVNPPDYTTITGNVIDGSPQDGRTNITNANVAGFLRILLFLSTVAEATDANFGSSYELSLKISVNPKV